MNDLRRDCVLNETLKFNIWGYIGQKVWEKDIAKKTRDFVSFSAGMPPVSGKDAGSITLQGRKAKGLKCSRDVL
jgi:hypothetical protein